MEIKKIIKESIAVKQAIINSSELNKNIEIVTAQMVECYRNGGTVYFCGNGGSAADAQHIAAELSGRFYYDRPPLAAEALHVNTSYLTAVANDYSYDEIYARYIRGVAKKGDILVGISTSGNSKNIIRAFEAANELGAKTVALTGKTGGNMKNIANIVINVPSTDTPRIQESHIMIGHIICQYVESEMFPR
ncbi:MAG: D-sedoheptulose 7-phosphate isomerase [Bacteroidales bacterium]|nr:D-sedoheptulose 7-phosphate isomerase [Bacteroidales bacterium]